MLLLDIVVSYDILKLKSPTMKKGFSSVDLLNKYLERNLPIKPAVNNTCNISLFIAIGVADVSGVVPADVAGFGFCFDVEDTKSSFFFISLRVSCVSNFTLIIPNI